VKSAEDKEKKRRKRKEKILKKADTNIPTKSSTCYKPKKGNR
jgi:hypothetical protein